MTLSAKPSERPFSSEGAVLPQMGSRELFPNLLYRAYLAHAAISPSSTAVVRACGESLGIVAQMGVASFPIWVEQRDRLRTSLGKLLGVTGEHIALTPGCTRGITDLALSLPWRKGDTVLTYEGEFPANVTPWQIAAKAHEGRVQFMELGNTQSISFASDTAARLEAALDAVQPSGTRIRWVAVSAVQFQTGVRMPLAAMGRVCQARGVRLLVDGIQACGVVPLELSGMGVDAFFCGAHKWLLGLEGAGFSYISPGLMAELTPLTAGWLSHEEGDLFLFRGAGYLKVDRPLKRGPRVFEGSTMNNLGYVALEVGVELCYRLTPELIYQHVQLYHDAVEGAFEERGFRSLRPKEKESRSCILSFRPPEGIELQSLSVALKEKGVVVSIPDGLLRLSPHYSNNVTEVPIVLEALDEALSIVREEG